MYRLSYHLDVLKKDISKISYPDRQKIKQSIELKLIVDPLRFGEPLRKSLKGYRKLRVGKYRIIYEVKKNEVIIWKIGHRRDIYKS